MKIKIILALLSLVLFSACQDKGYGTDDITNIQGVTSSEAVTILSITPANTLPQRAYIDLSFSSYMDTASLVQGSVKLIDLNTSAELSTLSSAYKNHLFIRPESSLTLQHTYRLTVKQNVKDIFGNTLDKEYTTTLLCVEDFYKSVEAGVTHSMAQSRDGDIFIWGSNLKKQIIAIDEDIDPEDESDLASLRMPLGISGLQGTLSYSAGATSSVMITKEKNFAALGEDTLLTEALADLQATSKGFNHTVVLQENGEIYSWGSNSNGQLGNGGIFESFKPVQEFTKAKDWSAISAGLNFTLALKSDGTLWGWGTTKYGQIGEALYNERRIPHQEDSNQTDWAQISAGGFHSAMLKTDGTLWSFGKNDRGQLGDGNTTDSRSAVQESSNATWTQVSAGYKHTCAIQTDSTLWCWGANDYGQLGVADTTDRNTPTQVGVDTDWQSVAAGQNYTLATKTNGTLWAWGRNASYQLGLADKNSDRVSPEEVK